jgi:hypothetical protein
MGTALEVLGLALPYSSGIPAVYPGRSVHTFLEKPGLMFPQRRLKSVSKLLNT